MTIIIIISYIIIYRYTYLIYLIEIDKHIIPITRGRLQKVLNGKQNMFDI